MEQIVNSSADVASGDRKNNSKNNTVIMESPAGTDNKGNSGLPLTSKIPAGGSEDQGLNCMLLRHLVMMILLIYGKFSIYERL